jgi:deoxycytidine triphosphate deaminase
MLLSGEAIRQGKLINDASEDDYRGASYDLHIGTIIDPTGEATRAYTLPAQGIVEVISRETVSIPKNIAGFATVKTSLCNEGILAINIGIVDPLYSGLVSSFLINFGKIPIRCWKVRYSYDLPFFDTINQETLGVYS